MYVNVNIGGKVSINREEAESHLRACNIRGVSNKSVLFVCLDNCCRAKLAEGRTKQN